MRELRLLITNSCNYNCFFCHHEGLQEKQEHNLNAFDYAYLYKAFRELYLNNEITVTGGEPLIRKDIFEILKALKEANAKTTLVTNGSFLEEAYQVGTYVDRINISLHSLDKNIYHSVVGTNSLDKVINGIHKIIEKYPNAQIRFNTTILKGLNDDKKNISQLLDFTSELKASIKFIELYPASKSNFVPLSVIENILKQKQFEKIRSNERQIIYLKDNAITAVLTKIFCAHAATSKKPTEYCSAHQDLFITPDGGIKTCMNTNEEISILNAIRNRDIKRLSHQLNLAISQMGKHCNQRKD